MCYNLLLFQFLKRQHNDNQTWLSLSFIPSLTGLSSLFPFSLGTDNHHLTSHIVVRPWYVVGPISIFCPIMIFLYLLLSCFFFQHIHSLSCLAEVKRSPLDFPLCTSFIEYMNIYKIKINCKYMHILNVLVGVSGDSDDPSDLRWDFTWSKITADGERTV